MTINTHQSPTSLTARSEFIALLDSALLVGSYRFARQITLTWLAYYPGDLPVRYRYGRLLIEAGQSQQAVQIISELCLADPEYIEAWKLFEEALLNSAKDLSGPDYAFFMADCHSATNALGGRSALSKSLPTWSNGVLDTRQALEKGDLETAEKINKLLRDCSRLYLTVDMDVFDPAFASAVQTPELEGFSMHQMLELLSRFVMNGSLPST